MKRPNRSPILLASIAGLAVVVGGLAVLIGTRPADVPAGSGQPASPVADPSAAVVAIPDTACPLDRQPGPDDKPPQPGGDAIDTLDFGSGRWRVCLDTPVQVAGERSAWCVWNDARTAVIEVQGLPTAIGNGRRVDGGVQVRNARAYVGVTALNGETTSFGDDDDRSEVQPKAGGTAGAAVFALDQVLDPEHPPAVKPPGVTGTIRWACGQPPPPRGGRSSGTVMLRLDSPVGQTWQIATRCDWIMTAAGPYVINVETFPPDIVFNDRFVGVQVGTGSVHASVGIWVDERDRGGSYAGSVGELVIPLGMAHDASSGRFRIRHLPMDEGVNVAILPGVVEVSGVVSWSCHHPAVPGPKGVVGQDPPDPDPILTEPGHATITFAPAVSAPVDTPVTCFLDTSDPDYLRVAELHAEFRADGRTVRMTSDAGKVGLVLIAADGSPHGEYVGQIGSIGDQADKAPLVIDAPEVAFEPTDASYVPLGGLSGPRTIAVTIDYRCDLAPGPTASAP